MANLKAPSVTVAFLEQAASAIERGDRGVIAMLVVDATAGLESDYTIYDITGIPDGLTAANKTAVKLALKGYVNAPQKILLHVIASADDYDDGLAALATMKWNYLVCPTAESDGVTNDIISWISAQRTAGMTYKAVLPNAAGDNPGIINVASYATLDGAQIAAQVVACRVAGIIAGCPLSMSVTYAPVTDFDDCQRLTPSELDTAVGAGKLVLMWDGEKVKICRGVTSFQTTSGTQGDSFKKIKLVEAMDMIRDDITMTAQDNYIGKYVNSYDNKLLLVTAINVYFRQLATEGVLASGTCEIDVEAQRNYFDSKGGRFVVDGETVTTESATEQQLKEGNTGSHVFLRATISLLDAIEDIDLNIYIG